LKVNNFLEAETTSSYDKRQVKAKISERGGSVSKLATKTSAFLIRTLALQILEKSSDTLPEEILRENRSVRTKSQHEPAFELFMDKLNDLSVSLSSIAVK